MENSSKFPQIEGKECENQQLYGHFSHSVFNTNSLGAKAYFSQILNLNRKKLFKRPISKSFGSLFNILCIDGNQTLNLEDIAKIYRLLHTLSQMWYRPYYHNEQLEESCLLKNCT